MQPAIAQSIRRTCEGTNLRIRMFSSAEGNDVMLHERYRGCTHIEGNLEIVNIHSIAKDIEPSSYSYDYSIDGSDYQVKDVDLSFLNSIEEVSGYVLIQNVYRNVISLDNLRLIRGQNTLDGDALVVITTHPHHLEGLRELHLSSLQEISQGGVRIEGNNHLCFVDTIMWEDIQPGLRPVLENNNAHCSENCDESCSGGCWSSEADKCQTLTLTICDDSCDHRCRGPSPSECCHVECAGGCTNEMSTGCLSCRNFENGDNCVTSCPPKMIYNPNTFLTEVNPDFKYEYRGQCFDACPDPLLGEGEQCVAQCSSGSREENGECIPCDGVCPKDCMGLGLNEHLTGDHIDDERFTNCTRIDGSILINDLSFSGDVLSGIVPIYDDHLTVFRTVREITGYLVLRLTTPRFNLFNFTFFENLEEIGGEQEFLLNGKLYVFVLHMTGLQIADFRSLRSVKGDIYEEDTCFHTLDMFRELLEDPETHEVRENAPKTECGSDTCHEQCTSIGCWGPMAAQCFSCENSKLEDGTCVPPCNPEEFYIVSSETSSSQTCGRCHEECEGGCTGPSNTHCNSCRNYQLGPYCVSECSENEFASEDSMCVMCPDFCRNGCTGTEHRIGQGGCDKCDFILLDHEGSFMRCMDAGESCDRHHASRRIPAEANSIYASSTVCQQCHHECKGGCSQGGDAGSCNSCRRHMSNGQCVHRCSSSEYSDSAKVCHACDSSCTECNNGTASDCTKCQDMEVNLGDSKKRCVSKCPSEFPLTIQSYTCVDKCPEKYFQTGDNICKSCHPECKGSCQDETSKGCFSCEHVTLDDSCVAECPSTYENTNGVCARREQTGGRSPTSPVKVIVLILILFLLVVLIIAITFFAWRIKHGNYRSIPNEVRLQDISRIEGNDNEIGNNGIA